LELIQLNVFKENSFEKVFALFWKSKNDEWFINLAHDFYSKSNPYKLSIEKGFLIFQIFEADLQLKTTNYPKSIKNIVRIQ